MNASNSKFKVGSGVYKCRCCGINTRETGSGESETTLCADCYELCGMDNFCNDNGQTPEQAGYVAEVARCVANIERKGGNVKRVKDWNDYLFAK